MIGWVEQHLAYWLGAASQVGSPSWFQVLAWLAALVAAAIAGISLRRQSLQSRAKLLLDLHVRWEALEAQRQVFSTLYRSLNDKTLTQHSSLQPRHQIEHMRAAFSKELSALRDGSAAGQKRFMQIMEVMSFFELLGTCVRNGYIPMRDADQMYKGPILQVDIAFRDFIAAWQKKAHMPPGLLENTIYLTRRTRLAEDRPVYYWTVYQIGRSIPWVRRLV